MPHDLISVFALGIAGSSYCNNILHCIHCGQPMDMASTWPKFTQKKGERSVRHKSCRGVTYLDN